LLVGLPVHILGNVLVSCFVFDWRPGGVWVPLIMTTTFWISFFATYPLIPADEKPSVPKYAKKTFVIAFTAHGGISVFIYALVIPTRLLAKSDNDILTLLVTGMVFPGLGFLTRKILTNLMQKHVASDQEASQEEKTQLLSNMCKGLASFIMFLPTVLMYLNTTPTLALLSALAQLVTEVIGKIWIIWATKRGFDQLVTVIEKQTDGVGDVLNGGVLSASRVKKLGGAVANVAVLASQEPGVHRDVDEAVTNAADDDGAMSVEKKEKALKYALAMLAIRWHAEIIAEKGSIMNAAIVAYLYLSDLVDSVPAQLALIGVLYFAVEVITDVIFVQSVVTYFGVPMLSAIPEVEVLSKDNLAGSALMALACTTMSVCIAMAASVPL
jgi:hypothetical protein